MTNKEKLKKAIDEDFNSENNYKHIIEKVRNKRNINLLRWSLVPISLLIIISGLIFWNNLEESNLFGKNKYSTTGNKESLNINDLSKEDISKKDVDVSTISNVSIPYPFKINDNKEPFIIPSDLNQSKNYVVYSKSEDTEIATYIMLITDGNNRNIEIRYSKDKEPVKDYYLNEKKNKTTTINNVDLRIYKYEEKFYIIFSYNGYYFDIETSNISEQELSNYLKSILK